MRELTYRGGGMRMWMKDDVRDITRAVFDHPIWKAGPGERVPPMPLDVQLELSSACNLKCDLCSHSTTGREPRLMEWGSLERIAVESADSGVGYFTICGLGEASIHPELFRFLGLVRSLRVEPKGLRSLELMPTVLITNGCWSDRQISECLENPPDLVCFSLAGLTDEEFHKRRYPLDVERFVHVVETIYAKRKRVRQVDGGLLPVIHVSTHITTAEMDARATEVEEFRRRFLSMADAVVVKPTLIAPKTLDSPRVTPCFETSRRLSMTADGDVWCGHRLPENFGEFLGNIGTQSLSEIWSGSRMSAFRQDVRAGRFDRECCLTCPNGARTEEEQLGS